MTRKKVAYDSLVRKRCRHPQAEWELCACDWHYHVTHGTYTTKEGAVRAKKFRGKIPDVRSHEDAKKAYALIAARIRNGQAPIDIKPTGGLTVEQLGKDWLSMERGRKPSVIVGYGEHLRVYINPSLGARAVTSLTSDDCEAFARALTPKRISRPLSTQTKQRIAMTLQALLSFAVRKKRIRSDNPAHGLVRELRDHKVAKKPFDLSSGAILLG